MSSKKWAADMGKGRALSYDFYCSTHHYYKILKTVDKTRGVART